MRIRKEMSMDTDKIKDLIGSDNLHAFYASKAWQRAAAGARVDQHNECQRCKAKGIYKPCNVVHHKKYVKMFPEFALSSDNLECLCFECHEEEHGRGFGCSKEPLTPERW